MLYNDITYKDGGVLGNGGDICVGEEEKYKQKLDGTNTK